MNTQTAQRSNYHTFPIKSNATYKSPYIEGQQYSSQFIVKRTAGGSCYSRLLMLQKAFRLWKIQRIKPQKTQYREKCFSLLHEYASWAPSCVVVCKALVVPT